MAEAARYERGEAPGQDPPGQPAQPVTPEDQRKPIGFYDDRGRFHKYEDTQAAEAKKAEAEAKKQAAAQAAEVKRLAAELYKEALDEMKQRELTVSPEERLELRQNAVKTAQALMAEQDPNDPLPPEPPTMPYPQRIQDQI